MADNELDVRQLLKPGLPQALTKVADIAGSHVEPDTVQVARKSNGRERELVWNVITVAPDGEIGTAA